MQKTRKPYPPELRAEMVRLVRAGRTPGELSPERGVTAGEVVAELASRHRTLSQAVTPRPGVRRLPARDRYSPIIERRECV